MVSKQEKIRHGVAASVWMAAQSTRCGGLLVTGGRWLASDVEMKFYQGLFWMGKLTVRTPEKRPGTQKGHESSSNH